MSYNHDRVDQQRELALAERYCRLSEAGYPPRQALDLAMRNDFDIEYWIRARHALSMHTASAQLATTASAS